jgi:hypothetical protein
LNFEHPDQASKLKQLVANNKKVVVSLGWGQNDIPAIEGCPSEFARSVKHFVDRNGLQGFDIDCEDPIFSSEVAFTEVSGALCAALLWPLALTITPTSLANLHAPTLNSMYDRVNVQSYWSDVSLFLLAGVLPGKIVAGINVEGGEPFERAVDQVHTLGLRGVYLWNCAGNVSLTIEAIRQALAHPKAVKTL